MNYYLIFLNYYLGFRKNRESELAQGLFWRCPLLSSGMGRVVTGTYSFVTVIGQAGVMLLP